MEISQGNDPIYRSMSREFSHPEDLYRSGTAIGAYQKHQLSSERLTTHQSTCTDRAVPPSLPHQQLFQSFQVSDLPISDLLTALQQFFIHFPAEFSFHNWIWRASVYHQSKITTFALRMFSSSASSGDTFVIEGNYLKGDFLLFQKVFAELQSSFQPNTTPPEDLWDDTLPSLDGFLSDDSDVDSSSKDPAATFDGRLQPVVAMIASPFLDMKLEALAILLHLTNEPSFSSSLSQLSLSLASYPNYFSCVRALLSIIRQDNPSHLQGAAQEMDGVPLALGCLAHLSTHLPTSSFLSEQKDFLSSLESLASHPLCQSQCVALQKHLCLSRN